jgi:hypothetical protein
MAIPALRYIDYDEDGCDAYECLACHAHLSVRSAPLNYCPGCGVKFTVEAPTFTEEQRYDRYQRVVARETPMRMAGPLCWAVQFTYYGGKEAHRAFDVTEWTNLRVLPEHHTAHSAVWYLRAAREGWKAWEKRRMFDWTEDEVFTVRLARVPIPSREDRYMRDYTCSLPNEVEFDLGGRARRLQQAVVEHIEERRVEEGV